MCSKSITSSGHSLASTGWLDQHFNFSRETYEAMVRWVGFQPGWHVLDAGCRGGSFVPLLAAQIGETGKVSALDLAPENVAEVEARIQREPVACTVEPRVGSVLSLPYPDQTFDAVWNANIQQYLTNDELQQMLAEFCRVTKPGGLVAVKDYTGETWYDSEANRALWRWMDAWVSRGDRIVLGWLRSSELPIYVREAGLQDMRRKFFGVEKDGPLNANDHAWRTAAWAYFAERAQQLDLPAADKELWQRLADPQYAARQLSSPDFHFRIEYIQVVGRVP